MGGRPEEGLTDAALCESHVGGTAADNRLFVEAVLYRYRAGIPWRDLPERFGDWKIVHQRFGRWAKSGAFCSKTRILRNWTMLCGSYS